MILRLILDHILTSPTFKNRGSRVRESEVFWGSDVLCLIMELRELRSRVRESITLPDLKNPVSYQ